MDKRILSTSNRTACFFWFKWVPDWGPEQRESYLTVLCLHIIIILNCYIIIKLLIMENHPSQNRKRNSNMFVLFVIEFSVDKLSMGG